MSTINTELTTWFVNQLSQLLVISPDDIPLDANLSDLGVDSQDSAMLIAALNDKLNTTFVPTIVEKCGSVEKLVNYVSADVNAVVE